MFPVPALLVKPYSRESVDKPKEDGYRFCSTLPFFFSLKVYLAACFLKALH